MVIGGTGAAERVVTLLWEGEWKVFKKTQAQLRGCPELEPSLPESHSQLCLLLPVRPKASFFISL